MNHVKIVLPGNGTPVVEVEGHNLAEVVSRLSFDAGASPWDNRLRLDFVPAEFLTEGEMNVVINRDLHDALLALGWTPPGHRCESVDAAGDTHSIDWANAKITAVVEGERA